MPADPSAEPETGFVDFLVLDETARLLVARGFGHLVQGFFSSTLQSRACTIEWTRSEIFTRGAAFMTKHIDQGWSFTDCLSFQVMKARRLREALTKDDHFEKAGFKTLLRESR